MTRSGVPARALLLVPGGPALLIGLNSALTLLDLAAPVTIARLAEVHGVLLVLGFIAIVVFSAARSTAVREERVAA